MDNKDNDKSMDITSYTNTKALLENAGNEGELYTDHISFTPDGLRRHLGFYILHGLSPSPEVGMKFKTQSEDDINGNDFVNWCIGPLAVKRHNNFRRFLPLNPRCGIHHQLRIFQIGRLIHSSSG